MPNALTLQAGLIRAVKGESTLSPEYQLVSGILANYPEAHCEYAKTGEDLTNISIWDGESKTLLLLTKVLTYSSDGRLTSKTVTDEINSKTLTVTYIYSGEDLVSKTNSIS